MVLLSRIYTKSGDKGKTSLGNGKRVLKNESRLHAIGAIDELNASIGLILGDSPDLKTLLQKIQNDLFDMGGDLCFPEDSKPEGALQITSLYVQYLEEQIDFYNKALETLKSFVLPGGSKTSAALHFSRTVARRAERDVCTLRQQEDINIFILQYLNRLSDLFFVLARYENQKHDGDVLWIPGGAKHLDKKLGKSQ